MMHTKYKILEKKKQYLLNYMIIKSDNDTRLLGVWVIDSGECDGIIINEAGIKGRGGIAGEEEI